MADIFVAGQTDDIDYQLLQGGSPFNLTGYTPDLDVIDQTGTVKAVPGGAVSVVDAATGKVRFAPPVGWLTVGVFRVRWKVTANAGGKVGYFPRGEREMWTVVL